MSIKKNRKSLYNSISLYIYKREKDFFYINMVEKIGLKDFLCLQVFDKKKYYFVNTEFFLSKILLNNNIEKYNKLLKLIQKKLNKLNNEKINIIFDYLPIRFFGKKFLKNNYFFGNFNEQKKLDYFLNKKIKKTYSRNISIQVLISRLDFLNDVFDSVINQSVKVKELFLFINFKDKNNVKLFENKFLKYFNYFDSNIVLLYSIKEVSESEARFFMSKKSNCQYILPLDDDDFLDKNCLYEGEKILNSYGDFSLIKGLYRGINNSNSFSDEYNDSDNNIAQKVKFELHRRKGNFLLPENVASVDQLYIFNADLLDYYGTIVPINLKNNTGIEIEIFLKSEEIGGVFLIRKNLYFRRIWDSQVTSNFDFQKQLFNYSFDLIYKVINYRNIKNYIKLDLFPFINLD